MQTMAELPFYKGCLSRLCTGMHTLIKGCSAGVLERRTGLACRPQVDRLQKELITAVMSA